MASRRSSYPHPVPIEAYGNGGFRFAGMSHRGSLLCLPSGIYAWAPADPASLEKSDFAPVIAEREIELLLLGSGGTHKTPGGDVRTALKDAGIALEVMSTGAACRTYNVLLAEGRRVAAALIAVE